MRLLSDNETTDLARRMYTRSYHQLGYERVIDAAHDAQLHNMAGREIESDHWRHRARLSLVHASLISGRPGYDYSNPSAFLTRLYLNKPTLQPTYGGGSQSPQGIAINVAAGNSALRKTW